MRLIRCFSFGKVSNSRASGAYGVKKSRLKKAWKRLWKLIWKKLKKFEKSACIYDSSVIISHLWQSNLSKHRWKPYSTWVFQRCLFVLLYSLFSESDMDDRLLWFFSRLFTKFLDFFHFPFGKKFIIRFESGYFM